MKKSVSMWSLDRKIQSEGINQLDFIKWAESEGLEYVELVSYYMEQENNLEQVIDLLKRTGIKVSCYTILNDFTTTSENRMQEFRHDLDVAMKLKSPFVRVLAGDENPDEASAVSNSIDNLRTAAIEASGKNITLVLENVGPYSTRSVQAKHLIDSVGSPAFRINFDTANSLLADEDPLEALDNLLDAVSYVHLKDFISENEEGFDEIAARDEGRIQKSVSDVAYTGITAGRGIVPLEEQINRLTARGYDGFVSIEYEGTGDSEKDTIETLAYLDSIL